MASADAKTPTRLATERERVLSLVRRFGFSANSFQALQNQFDYWFRGTDACVAYFDTGAAWVAAGAPIADAATSPQVAIEFVEQARERGRRVAFFGTELPFITATTLRSVLVGSQPSFSARDWPKHVSSHRDLRRQLRRARAKGLHLERLDIPNSLCHEFTRSESEVCRLIDAWFDSKPLPPMGFLANVQPFSFSAERRYFTARVARRLVGLAVMAPIYAKGGWLLENLVRSSEAPNGTIESLIDAAVTSAVDAEDAFVTLGLTPLAGDIAGWLRVAKRLASPLYNFVGLERFRLKLQPSVWAPVYITFDTTQTAPAAIYDCLVAFAHGNFSHFSAHCGMRWLQKTRGPRWELSTGQYP